MTSEPMATRPCDECGGTLRVAWGEGFRNERVTCWWAMYCDSCRFGFEADDYGPLPDELRLLDLERSGTWTVTVYACPGPAAWKVLREVLELGIADVLALKRRLPAVVHEGTKGEAHILQHRLARADIVMTVARIR